MQELSGVLRNTFTKHSFSYILSETTDTSLRVSSGPAVLIVTIITQTWDATNSISSRLKLILGKQLGSIRFSHYLEACETRHSGI